MNDRGHPPQSQAAILRRMRHVKSDQSVSSTGINRMNDILSFMNTGVHIPIQADSRVRHTHEDGWLEEVRGVKLPVGDVGDAPRRNRNFALKNKRTTIRGGPLLSDNSQALLPLLLFNMVVPFARRWHLRQHEQADMQTSGGPHRPPLQTSGRQRGATQGKGKALQRLVAQLPSPCLN